MTPAREPDPLRPSRVPPIRRPLVGLAICFVLGTAAGLLSRIAVPWLFAAATALAATVLALFRRRIASAALFPLAVAIGWIHAALAVDGPSCRELGARMSRPREFVSVTGVVVDEPDVEPGWKEGDAVQSFVLRVEGVRRTEGWERARGSAVVRWTTDADARPAAYGERWILSGVLGRRSPGEGRVACRPAYELRAERAAGTFVSAGHGSAFVAWCLRARRACFELLGRGLEDYPEQAGLLRALLLGCRQEMPDEVYRDFSVTGTLHVIAISGLHVAVMAMLVVAFLKGLGISRPHWILYLAPALVVYTVATGMSASAVRACAMAVVFWASPLFGRRPDGPTALALAAILILAFAPDQLGDLGFQFSFAALAGLMIFYPPWMRPVQAALAPDPWRVQPERLPVRTARAAAREAASVGVGSVAALLATAPLTAYYFNLVSPVALLGNLVAIPLSFVILLTGVLSLAVGSWWGAAAEVFNHANRVFISAMLHWVDGMAAVPCGHGFVPSPPLDWIVFWYAVLALGMSSRGLARRMVVAAAALVAAVGLGTSARGSAMTVDFLDVGQGDAAFVNVPGSGDLLVDAGPRRVARAVVRHLRRQGVDRLEALVLTHGDADHAGGAIEVLRALPVREVWCPPFVSQSRVCLAALQEAGCRGIRVRRLARGDCGSLGGGVEWEVLHPGGGEPSRRSGDVSLVLRMGGGPGSVLFMGGAGESVERALLRQPLDVGATVLAAGDHGAVGTCTPPWLAAVAPEQAVISVGAGNDEGCPDNGVLRRLAARGVPAWRTDEQGSARVNFRASPGPDGRPFEIAPIRPRPAR